LEPVGENFEFVGETYIHGLMEGEALDGPKSRARFEKSSSFRRMDLQSRGGQCGKMAHDFDNHLISPSFPSRMGSGDNRDRRNSREWVGKGFHRHEIDLLGINGRKDLAIAPAQEKRIGFGNN
jgi:hypothetical protein